MDKLWSMIGEVAIRLPSWTVHAVIGIVLLLGAFPAGSYASTTSQAPEAGATPRGYPMLLSTGPEGGVWFGGATSGFGRPEGADRIDHITPTGTFLDLPFPSELYGYWPEALAPGQDGEEWFLARKEGDPTPVLGKVSLLGQFTVHELQVPAGSVVRGLAVGPEGNLWTTDTRIHQGKRTSAILRVSPSGSVTAFSAGLRAGAAPENITAGPEGSLWFLDAAGHIGRVDVAGKIKEFPIGRRIEWSRTFGPPAPIVAGPQAVWFVLNSSQLGRMSFSGHVQIFTPLASVKPPRGYWEAADTLEGLAIGPGGELWFTRSSGAVLRIDARGHVKTITDRLVAGRGIAFTGNGAAWIGEEASFRPEDSNEVIPARVARISAKGMLTQYPEPPPCHMPFVLGDGPSHATEEIRDNNCELAGIRRPPRSHSNHLIVVSQSTRAGAVVGYKTSVHLVLGPKPPPPKTCRAPRYVRVLADSRRLVAWVTPIVEADDAQSKGEGPQRYVACVPGHGAKHVFITERFNNESYTAVEDLHTAGHLIAFTASSVNHYNNGTHTLALFDVQRGRLLFKASYPIGEGRSQATVESFTLDSRGDLAWVKQNALWSTVKGETAQTSRRYTLKARYSGHVHTIEETTSSISGLALRQHVLRWVSDGLAHSLPLR